MSGAGVEFGLELLLEGGEEETCYPGTTGMQRLVPKAGIASKCLSAARART
jgi:hypothetical protein